MQKHCTRQGVQCFLCGAGWGLLPFVGAGAPFGGSLATWEKAKTGYLPRNGASQWSTLESGPLATQKKTEIGQKRRK